MKVWLFFLLEDRELVLKADEHQKVCSISLQQVADIWVGKGRDCHRDVVAMAL